MLEDRREIRKFIWWEVGGSMLLVQVVTEKLHKARFTIRHYTRNSVES